MNKDFHLYGTYLATREAGYDDGEAKKIALAAQMVDDFSPKLSEKNHTVTKMYSKTLKAVFMDSDKFDISDTWMPFHFIPKKADTKSGEIFHRFSCGYGEPIENITAQLNSQSSLEQIGLTMHVLADSFAHQNFCGVVCKDVDTPENIQIYLGSEYSGLTLTDHIPVTISKGLPCALYYGHGSAGHVPDLSWLKYDFNWKESKKQDRRNNPLVFVEAYKKMVEALVKIKTNNNVADVVAPDGAYMTLADYLETESVRLQIEKQNIIKKNNAIDKAKSELGVFGDLETEIEYEQVTYDISKDAYITNTIKSTAENLSCYEKEEINFDENIDTLFYKLCNIFHANGTVNDLNNDYNKLLKDFNESPASRTAFENAAIIHKNAVYNELGITSDDLKKMM